MSVFDEAALHGAITEALHDADIPDGHKHAFVLVATVDGTVKGVISTKVNDFWTVESFVKVSKGNPLEVGAQLKGTW